jgi:di/tricarboxylate transporter
MTIETILVFGILIVALVLFFTGWMRMDIVALLVLGTLAVTGLVSPEQALSGFSNPAVITVWSMFILSAAFSYTGVARMIGRQMFRLAGSSEWRVILVIMLISGLMSSVMNNIGVAALMLPVVMDIARTTKRSPARLLLPLAMATHLGGLTTLIGNPANLVVSVELEKQGYDGFELFDFSPLGFSVMLIGTIFVAFLGRFFLIKGKSSITSKTSNTIDYGLTDSYHLRERTFLMNIKPNSGLEGKTLAESLLRPALGVNVLSVKRNGGGTILNPGPDTLLRELDTLFVQGRFESIKSMHNWEIILPGQRTTEPAKIDYQNLNCFEITVEPDSPLIGKIKKNSTGNFKILAIRRNGKRVFHDLTHEILNENDIVLVQSDEKLLEDYLSKRKIESYKLVGEEKLRFLYKLHEHLFFIKIGDPSELLQDASADNLLLNAFGLTVIGLMRNQQMIDVSNEQFKQSDQVLVKGQPDDMSLLKGLIRIELLDEKVPVPNTLENENLIMAEAILAPRSALAGKTLMEINFRKKYGLTILALWREGKAIRTNIHNTSLRFGEALLMYGKRDKIAILNNDSDFILLTDTIVKPLRTHKAATSVLVMLAVLVPVMFGFIPIEITSVIGVALMVITGCLTMEEAYQSIEWRSVFLIAGMLPLGIAMQQSGAADVLSGVIENFFGQWGKWGILTGIYLLAMVLTLALHPAALVVIISPIVLQSAESYDISPYSLMIMITVASSSLLSPVSHPANLLVMGPGGYQFKDYIKFGLPLALVVMAIVFLLLPVFWPL